MLLAALLLSLLLHVLGISGALDWLSENFRYEEPEAGPPLRAVLKPPPPPTYQAESRPPPRKHRPRPKPKPAPPAAAPTAVIAPAATAEATQPADETARASIAEPAANPPVANAAPPAEAPVVAPVAAPLPQEEPESALAAPPPAAVPKRIDLVGTVTVGEQGFMVGAGGFRLRHDGNRYEISVLGQPRGLARLLLHGEFTGTSRGAITAAGLQPSEYIEERGRSDRRESATLDWEAGVIHLKDGQIVPIEPPTYDRLSVILQFYYRPPEAQELSMRVAGTRNVDTYTFRREAVDRLALKFGEVDADRWRANFDDGNPRVEIWMSPEYHYLPLRVRIHTRKADGGHVATLTIDEIRVGD